ncbi:PREDICTED: uncharacterized protein LOC109192344 isoform X2 [Ipomoea nil]|uniref:uncharacterized protein LOC109192344 isoform X2 n=1 Tax=Ipomoea nil TaxID=35883 RepID=UPI0009019291|nr:PREDICTED: uncharacterized protein LOC109192344 isoform X2 [Ipomoea nil]
MATESKRSGHIPAFGEWDKADGLPITQYFECARQAGLIRYSAEYDPYITAANGGAGEDDLYAVKNFHQPPTPPRRRSAAYTTTVPTRKVKGGKSCPQYAKGQKRPVGIEPGKTRSGSQKQFQEQVSMKSIRDVTHPQRPKPVDEDLYKIPPELLHQRNRKKVFGFFSRCLAPPCIA